MKKENLNKSTDLQQIKNECPNIISFLENYFGNNLSIGLDYLTILKSDKFIQLPILCLVGNQATGKTAFINFINDLFPDKVYNNTDSINYDSLSKKIFAELIIINDDVELNNVQVVNLKRLHSICGIKTSENSTKNIAPCIIVTSNNLESIKLTNDNRRFWTIETKQPTKQISFDSIKEEIPTFINYLKNRDLNKLSSSFKQTKISV